MYASNGTELKIAKHKPYAQTNIEIAGRQLTQSIGAREIECLESNSKK